jgi:hypothetical protein
VARTARHRHRDGGRDADDEMTGMVRRDSVGGQGRRTCFDGPT